MTEKMPLADQLAMVSLRTLLQKALLHALSTAQREPLGQRDSVALGQLQVGAHLEYQYGSAIAHQLAATYPIPAATLAPPLAEAMTAYFAQSSTPQDRSGAIATGLQIQPTPEGWLLLTLSAPGLATWLQSWQHVSLVTRGTGQTAGNVASPALAGHWPLCDRLQLSLPMLLQWAYARCHTWRQALGDKPMGASSESLSPLTSREWPQAAHCLLPTVIQAVDQIAARAGAHRVSLRQGYQLATQVYRCDAAMAQWPAIATGSREAAWLAATLTATQQVLALILTHNLHVTPCAQL